MKDEIRQLWTAALRSGEYKQGRQALHLKGDDGESRYCCLGVLCELAIKAGVAVSTREEPERPDMVSYNDQASYPPDSVMEWAGLPNNNPPTPHGSLAHLNDSGVSFADIADIIDEHLREPVNA